MKKRGVSAVVATILIILITIAGVGIVWGIILPMFGDVNYLSYSDVQLDVVLEGYTVYDPDMHFALVQVSRGNDNKDLKSLEFVFDMDGNSVPYRNSDVPMKNERRTYAFNFTKDSIEGEPDSVSIAPVFNLNGQERLGSIIATKKIPSERILGINEWSEKAITSIVRQDYLVKHGLSDGGGDEENPPEWAENPETTCDDGYDNDGDNHTDCADIDCYGRADCGNCSGAGEQIQISPDDSKQFCCDGLIKTGKVSTTLLSVGDTCYYQGIDVAQGYPEYGFCADCGNGVCESDDWESYCSCPEDCEPDYATIGGFCSSDYYIALCRFSDFEVCGLCSD